MAVSGYVLILLAMLMCVECQEYSNMLQKSMKNVGTSSLQFCLNDEQKLSVSRVDPTIPLNLDDRNVSCPASSVKCEGSSKCECGNHLHGKITSNVMENSMNNIGQNESLGMPGISSLQFCLKDEQESSVACMDAILDEGNVSCPAWSVEREGSSKCECGSDLHGKVTCCQNLEKLLIFQCFCVTYDSTTIQHAIMANSFLGLYFGWAG